jgi:hypothetical protein
VGASHFLEAAVLPCSDDEARAEGAACDDQVVRHGDLSGILDLRRRGDKSEEKI